MASVKNVNQYHATSSEWAEKNPVLAEGDIAFETDSLIAKVGDGSTAYVGLPGVKLVQVSFSSI
jgi:hypothetical protein